MLNKKIISKLIILCSVFSLMLIGLNYAIPVQGSTVMHTKSLKVNAKSALVMDANSGQVIYAKNDKKLLPLASVSKLITAYIVLNQIKSGNLQWNSKVKISPAIAKLSQNKVQTNVPLTSGHTYTVKQLFTASLVHSANGAAMALGNRISGNTYKFSILMNKTVKNLGIKDASFYNACGLSNVALGKSLENHHAPQMANNKMSALGIATFARILIKKYPIILQTTSMKSFNWYGKTYNSSDDLLGNKTAFKIDGLKTGYSYAAGGNFVGTGTKNNRRIITVILGGNNQNKFQQTSLLFNSVNKYLKPTKQIKHTEWVVKNKN